MDNPTQITHPMAWKCPGINCLKKDQCMRYKEGSGHDIPILQFGWAETQPSFDGCTDFWSTNDPTHFLNLAAQEEHHS